MGRWALLSHSEKKARAQAGAWHAGRYVRLALRIIYHGFP